MQSGKVPVIIGVTGARRLRPEEIPALREAVRQEIRDVRHSCLSSPVLLMTGLAEGADQLCARTALEEGCGLIASLPMPMAEYERDFNGAALEELRSLCGLAKKVFVVPETEPHQDTRDYLYRQEGIYVAKNCHLLLAVWNGTEEKADGCGTAETIGFRMHGSYRQGMEESLTADGGSVIIIHAAREEDRPAGGNGDPAGRPPKVTRYGEEQLRSILEQTEQFNRETEILSKGERSHLPCGGREPVMKQMDLIYGTADALSLYYATRFRKTIAAVSASAVMLTMAFLMYDELSMYWMVLICWIMLGCLFLLNRMTRRIPSHRKYTEYRLLAEGMRVQSWLFRAGMNVKVRDIMPSAWQLSVPWTMYASTAAGIGPIPEKHPVLDGWVKEQKQYHEKALNRTGNRMRRNDRILRTAVVLTVLSYAAALVFEIIWGGLTGGEPGLPPESLETVRTVLKVTMGTLSAVSVFSGNYYGKLCLEETENDHIRMARLFSTAEERIAREGETPELLYRLAREELNENTRWYAYQSVNKPDLGI